jgi:hypothetical protein
MFRDSIHIMDAPELKLSEQGEAELESFYAAGGNHRTAALKVLEEEEKERIGRLEEYIRKKEGKEGTKNARRVAALQKELGEKQEKLKGLGKWTAILYNEGGWVLWSQILFIFFSSDVLQARGNRLGLALSKNEMDVRQVEDNAEKSTMRYLEYRNEREVLEKERNGKLTAGDRAMLAKLAEKKGATDKILKRCLQSEDVVSFWKALTSISVVGRFLNTKYMASKWTDGVVHQPGGGVSDFILLIVFLR